MAATVTSPWGNKPKSWALDSEEHDQELIHQHTNSDESAAVTAPLADFPSLAAVSTTKAKKKKPQTMNLAEFSTYDASKFREPKDVDVMNLPKGPRERSAEELEMNKGFRSWGSDRGSRDEPRRAGGFRDRESKEFTPSRADETDNWGAAKKGSGGGGGGFERRERGGFFENSQSKADESDNWGANKSYVPSERKYERQKVGFESSGGADSDNWGKKKEEEGRKFGAFDSLRERRGGGGFERDETWGKKREDLGSGSGSGSVRPKLNLQPRKVPIGDEVHNEGVVKPKGSNPFGDARPREEVLKEKGQDWKEVDEKLESFKLKEKEAASDGPGFGKRSFGSGNGLSGGDGDRSERSWRKPVDVDVRPQSGENTDRAENGHAEEAETSNSENCA